MDELSAIWIVLALFSGTFGNNQSGYFWHITDVHYDHTYSKGQLSCNDEVLTPGKYGDYWCDSPWLLVEDSIVSMSHINNNVDFIIWTGDNVGHIKTDKITLNTYIETLQNITDIFRVYFPNVNVYGSLGNHDFYPKDQASSNGSRIYETISQIWIDWMSNQTDIDVIKEGGYYAAQVTPKIRLLSLNTVLYFRSNSLTSVLDDPADQMAWMVKQFQEARENGEKVIVTAHVPPGLLIPRLTDWFSPRHKSKFVNILLQFSDVIAAAHFGHDHKDNFKILQNEVGNQAVAQFAAPSVTPWRYRIENEVGLPHNPGIRLVEYDRVTGRHINYVQYYMNLTESNRDGKSNWTKLYSFKDEYNVADMSIASLRQILSRMENGKGLEYATKYCTNSLVSNYEIKCTDKERAEIYCGGLKFDLKEAEDCVIEYMKILNTASVHFLNTLFILCVSVAAVFMTAL